MRRLFWAGVILSACMLTFTGCDILGGIQSEEEVMNEDLNGDGIPDYMQEDKDGDGIPDYMQEDKDGDGIPDYMQEDKDGDGIPDNMQEDMDGDGIPDHMQEDKDGDGIPDNMQEEKRTLYITPKSINISNAQGFVVFDNGTYVPGSSNAEDFWNPSYTLYTINWDDKTKAAAFDFKVKTDKGDVDNEMQGELSKALQLVPRLMTDMGDYVLFAICSINVLNQDSLSEKTKSFLESIANDDGMFAQTFGFQPEYRDRLTYLVRKSDGVMFDLTTQPIFSYIHRTVDYNNSEERLGHSDGWWQEKGEIPLMSTATYKISDQGNIFTSSGSRIYRISTKGNSIDVQAMTQPHSYHEKFAIDDDENIFIPIWEMQVDSHDYNIYIYKSGGGFNMSNLNKGYYLDMQKDDKGEFYLLETRENDAGFTVASLKDGNCTVLYESDPDDDEKFHSYMFCNISHYHDTNHFGTCLGYNNGEFRWFYGSYRNHEYNGIMLSYNPALNKTELLPVPTAIETAMSDKYDAIEVGTRNIGVKLGNNSIELTDFDFAAGTVGKRSYDVEAMSGIVGTKCLISQITPTVLVFGKSTADGSDVVIPIDISTGENLAAFDGDSRKVVSQIMLD